MPRSVVLANGRPGAGPSSPIVMVGERIVSVGQDVPPGATVVDLDGRLVLPALIDAHIHLDKTRLGLPWHPHAAENSVTARIEAEKALRRKEPPAVVDCGGRLLNIATRRGTLFVRSHVDVDDQTRLENVAVLLRLREAWSDLVTIQLVAFPQSGIKRCPGAAEWLTEAVRMGCDLIGGLDPVGIDDDLEGHLDVVFGIAERFGVGIDMHLHDQGETGIGELLAIAKRTKALGMGGKVAVSHAFCLGSVCEHRALTVCEHLAESGVSIITSAPGAAPMPPVRRLRQAGVHVAAGSDNIRDAWSPFGNADMLERCWLVAWRSGLRTDADIAATLDLATTKAADVLGLADYGLVPGAYADLVALRSDHLAQAVIERPSIDFIVRRGRIVRDAAGLAIQPTSGPMPLAAR